MAKLQRALLKISTNIHNASIFNLGTLGGNSCGNAVIDVFAIAVSAGGTTGDGAEAGALVAD